MNGTVLMRLVMAVIVLAVWPSSAFAQTPAPTPEELAAQKAAAEAKAATDARAAAEKAFAESKGAEDKAAGLVKTLTQERTAAEQAVPARKAAEAAAAQAAKQAADARAVAEKALAEKAAAQAAAIAAVKKAADERAAAEKAVPLGATTQPASAPATQPPRGAARQAALKLLTDKLAAEARTAQEAMKAVEARTAAEAALEPAHAAGQKAADAAKKAADERAAAEKLLADKKVAEQAAIAGLPKAAEARAAADKALAAAKTAEKAAADKLAAANLAAKESLTREPPPPHVAWVFPAGAQRGQTVDVTVGGQNLAYASAVRVSGAGVTGTVVKAEDPKRITIKLTVAPDAPLGLRDLRVVTHGGASTRFRFFVGQLPEVNEVEPNSTKPQAQKLPSLPILVNGQTMGGDRDIFRFAAQAGQTLVCRVDARKILPYIADAVPGWLQSVLTLYDADGNEVAYDDDFRQNPDAVLIYKVPKDGEYLLEISDSIFRGREDFIYRLSVGALPQITDIYPLGGRRGGKTAVQLFGVNLTQQALELPLAADACGVLPVCLTCSGLLSNELPFYAGEYEEAAEVEPNDTPAQATKLKMNMTVNGRIGTPGDTDFFVITAKAGQDFIFEVHARRLDSPLDSLLVVQNAAGTALARGDDYVDDDEAMLTHHADSRVAWRCLADGDYHIRLTDVQGKGGPEYAYRLTACPPRPDYSLRVFPSNLRLAGGDTAIVSVYATRRDGFADEIQLAVKNLPAGFAARGAVIAAKTNEVRFTLTAPPNLPSGLLAPTIEGTAVVAGQKAVRQALPAEEVQQAFSFKHRPLCQELLLAVFDRPIYTLSVDVKEDQFVDVVPGGEAAVVVRADRKTGGDQAIRLTGEPSPGGQVAAKFTQLPADKNEASMPLTCPKTAAVGAVQTMLVTGIMKAGKNDITRFAPLFKVRVVAPPPATQPAAAPAPAPGPKK